MKELKTITQSKLHLFEENRNNQNVFTNKELDDFMKSKYIEFFENFKNDILNNKYISFSKAWVKHCNSYWKILNDDLVQYKGTVKFEPYQSNKICNKFRGNVGEILAEYILTEFGSYIDKTTYNPVDPFNERFLDATAMSKDGFETHIQVKNFSGPIDYTPFWKLCFEGFIYLYTHPELANDYLKRQRLILVTFTDTVFSKNEEDYKRVVKVISPKEIDTYLPHKDQDAWIDLVDCIVNNLNNN